jgi:penicillin-binding protein 1B
MTRDAEVLKRYPLMVERVVEPGPAFLINYGLQRVVLEGTAKSASSRLGSDLGLAGKTGTTDDSRDSWFAGFSGNTLGVVWIGRDDNGKTGLTGATGALPVWTDLFSGLDLRPLSLAPPDGVEQLWVERSTGLLSAEYCSGSMPLPYVSGYAPEPAAGCIDQRNVFERASNWLRGFMR